MLAVRHRHRPAPPSRNAAERTAEDKRAEQARLDALLDDALAATFPASDPIALPAPPA